MKQTKSHNMKNFSQNNEQVAILEYFKDFKGTFLSIGENDGETLSNVRALALEGWRGVMVEPAPVAFMKLKRLYPHTKKKFYLYNCAIGLHDKMEILHDSGCLLQMGDTSLVSTLVEAETDRFKKVLDYHPVKVQAYRWKTFFNRLTLKKFDMISLDAEGMDVEILGQMDITGIKLIVVEWNGHEDRKAVFDEKMKGFKIIYTSGENLIYAI